MSARSHHHRNHGGITLVTGGTGKTGRRVVGCGARNATSGEAAA